MVSKSRRFYRTFWPALVACALVATGTTAMSPADDALDGYERFVRSDGSLHYSRAAGAGLVHLGSWFVPAGEAAGFHHVYTQAEAIAAFRETGRFPDGTALVKEIVSERRADYTTGSDVASATSTRQWFLMVKAAAGRFDGNPLWGDGWGWALFESDDPAQNVATDYRSDCLGCHLPARATDWVYTQGYPALEAAVAAPDGTPTVESPQATPTHGRVSGRSAAGR